MVENLWLSKDEILGVLNADQNLSELEISNLERIESSDVDLMTVLTPKERRQFFDDMNMEYHWLYKNTFWAMEFDSIMKDWRISKQILQDRTDSRVYKLYVNLCKKLWESPNSLEFMVCNSASLYASERWKDEILSWWDWYQKYFDTAISLQNQILQKEPDNKKVLNNLWNMYAERGLFNLQNDPSNAKQDLTTSLKYFDLTMWDKTSLANKWLVYFALGNVDASIQCYDKLFKTDSTNIGLVHNLVKLCALKWDNELARTYIDRFRQSLKKKNERDFAKNFENSSWSTDIFGDISNFLSESFDALKKLWEDFWNVNNTTLVAFAKDTRSRTKPWSQSGNGSQTT